MLSIGEWLVCHEDALAALEAGRDEHDVPDDVQRTYDNEMEQLAASAREIIQSIAPSQVQAADGTIFRPVPIDAEPRQLTNRGAITEPGRGAALTIASLDAPGITHAQEYRIRIDAAGAVEVAWHPPLAGPHAVVCEPEAVGATNLRGLLAAITSGLIR